MVASFAGAAWEMHMMMDVRLYHSKLVPSALRLFIAALVASALTGRSIKPRAYRQLCELRAGGIRCFWSTALCQCAFHLHHYEYSKLLLVEGGYEVWTTSVRHR